MSDTTKEQPTIAAVVFLNKWFSQLTGEKGRVIGRENKQNKKIEMREFENREALVLQKPTLITVLKSTLKY